MGFNSQIKLFFIFPLIFLIQIAAGQSAGKASSPATARPRAYSQPRYYFNHYNFSSLKRDKSRLDVYWGFVNDILQFVKKNDQHFEANYEIEMQLLDKNENYVDGHSHTAKIFAQNYAETNSNTIVNQGKFSFVAQSGEYQLRIELRDLDTRKHLLRERDVILKDFSLNKAGISDLSFVENDGVDSCSSLHHPNFSAMFTDSTKYAAACYEVYPPQNSDSLRIKTKIKDAADKTVFTKLEIIPAEKLIIQRHFPLLSQVKEPGRYSLEIQVSALKSEAKIQQHFFINWNNMPFSLDNVKAAVEPLMAIGNANELKKIEDATDEEKSKILTNFWKRRDPTPGTEKNEVKDEFYQRVEFCFRQFSLPVQDVPGWKTDRGRVYLRFGEPSLIQKYVSDIDRPAREIWFYDSIHQRFIFTDRFGFGEFKLIKVE